MTTLTFPASMLPNSLRLHTMSHLLVLYPTFSSPCLTSQTLAGSSRSTRDGRNRGRNPGRVFSWHNGAGGTHGRFRTVSSVEDETGSVSSSSDESSPPPVAGEVAGQKKSSPGPRAVPPDVGIAAAQGGGGGLGDFSLLQTRRFWLGTTVGALAALGGNLAGVTSSIFNLNPEVCRSVRADLLYPVKGFKRCLDTSEGFEFIYPSSWVGDQRLLYRAVERAERERALDLPPLQGRGSLGIASSRDPVVAFGPPGTAGELNVSVVVAPVVPGFTLQTIGGPQEAGERILKQSIAPEGSKKVAVLLNARQRLIEDRLYYSLEYTVKGKGLYVFQT